MKYRTLTTIALALVIALIWSVKVSASTPVVNDNGAGFFISETEQQQAVDIFSMFTEAEAAHKLHDNHGLLAFIEQAKAKNAAPAVVEVVEPVEKSWDMLTNQEKVNMNPQKCNLELQVMWASDGSCHDKYVPPVVREPQTTQPTPKQVVQHTSQAAAYNPPSGAWTGQVYGGNPFAYNQCTYVAFKYTGAEARGHAKTWGGALLASGWKRVSTPGAKSIGVKTSGAYGHVAVLMQNYGNGTGKIVEGNYNWSRQESTRVINLNTFTWYSR